MAHYDSLSLCAILNAVKHPFPLFSDQGDFLFRGLSVTVFLLLFFCFLMKSELLCSALEMLEEDS